MQVGRDLDLAVQDAVDAVADHRILGFRLDVDVAGLVAHRLGNDGVDDADNGRDLRGADQLLDVDVAFLVLDDDVDLVDRLQVGHIIEIDAGLPGAFLVDLLQLLEDLRAARQHRRHLEPGHQGDIVALVDVRGVGHGQGELAPVELDRHHPTLLAQLPRQELDHLGTDGELPQVDVFDVEVFLQGADNLRLAGDAEAHQGFGDELISLPLPQTPQVILLFQQPRLAEDVPQNPAVLSQPGRVVLDLLLLLFGDLPELFVLLDEHVLLQSQTDGEPQVLIVPGLGDELVDRPFVDRPHDGLHVGVAGEHDADDLRPAAFDLLEHLGPGHPRHAVVGDHQVDLLLGQSLQGVLRIRGGEDLVVLVDENPPQGLEHPGLVVDEQQGEPLLGNGRLLLHHRLLVLRLFRFDGLAGHGPEQSGKCTHGASFATGNWIIMAVPSPGRLSASMVPPAAVTAS